MHASPAERVSAPASTHEGGRRRCAAIARSGRQCPFHDLHADGLCTQHSKTDSAAAQRQKRSRAGSVATMKAARQRDRESVDLDTLQLGSADDVLHEVKRALVQLQRSSADPSSIASARKQLLQLADDLLDRRRARERENTVLLDRIDLGKFTEAELDAYQIVLAAVERQRREQAA